MANSNKYYCLHNNGTKSENEMFLLDLPEQFDHKMRYRLIEKTEKDGSECITAIFSLNTLSECYSITKGRDIYIDTYFWARGNPKKDDEEVDKIITEEEELDEYKKKIAELTKYLSVEDLEKLICYNTFKY
jgi:cell division protein ZapA (FtsZ GTPase activity inhibitor)